MITQADLKTQTRRDLADTAKSMGVTGWHAMRKDELIDAIRRAQRSSKRSSAGSGGKASASKTSAGKRGKASTSKGAKTASAKGAEAKKASTRSATKNVAARGGTGKTAKASGAKSGGPKSSGAKSQAVKASGSARASRGSSTAAAGGKTQRKSTASAGKSSAAKKTTAKSAGSKATRALKASTKSSGRTSSAGGKATTRGASSKATGNRVSAAKSARGESTRGKSATAKASTSKASPKKAPTSKAASRSTTTSKKTSGKAANTKPRGGRTGVKATSRKQAASQKPTSPKIAKVLRRQQAEAESRKDLSACVRVKGKSGEDGTAEVKKDRIVLIVRDSYWLQASWEIGRSAVERARAAMGADWHAADPILRLTGVAHGSSVNSAEQVIRDIPIHGGVNNWYIDVDEPPRKFRVLIGYRAKTGRFYTLCRSNIVETPAPGACDPIEGHWEDIAEDYERIYSLSESENSSGSNDLREMFEDRLQRPMIDLSGENFVGGSDFSFRRERELPFEVDAELIVYGSTAPGSSVTLAGKPVRLSEDGSFTVRMELPDKRQVIPVVACSRDGMRQRTTVVAVERNTKVMEPVSRTSMPD